VEVAPKPSTSPWADGVVERVWRDKSWAPRESQPRCFQSGAGAGARFVVVAGSQGGRRLIVSSVARSLPSQRGGRR
jgi:hypothetical protein